MRRLVQLRTVPLDAQARRLGSCYDIADLRRAAKRRIPRPVFDYVDGAADEEIAVAANVAAFRSWRFLPRVLAGVASADTSVPVLRLDAAGSAGVRGRPGTPGCCTRTGRSAGRGRPRGTGCRTRCRRWRRPGIEELRAAASGRAAELWFQLYLTRDRARSYDLVARAADNGYSTLVVTVDTIVAGNRVRDLRNGLSIPPALTLATVASVASKPSYWYHLLSGPPLDYANFAGGPSTTVMKTADFFDPDLNWSDIEELRARWPGKLLLKGPVGPADARRAMELGRGRGAAVQPRRAAARPDRRPRRPDRAGAGGRGPSFTVLVDSGVRHGADVAVALALGADAAVLGRAYLYGLMAGGEAGVDRALDLLIGQFKSTMQFLGMTSVAELRKHGRDLLTRAAVLRAGREGRAALDRAGGRVGERGRGFSSSSARARSTATSSWGSWPTAQSSGVMQHLRVGVDAVVLHGPAELVEPGGVPRDGDPGAVDQAVAVAVDADHAAPGAGADHRAEAERLDRGGHDVAVRARELVGERDQRAAPRLLRVAVGAQVARDLPAE